MPESSESIGHSNTIPVDRSNANVFEHFRDKQFKFDIRNFDIRVACKINDYIIAWIWYENSPEYSSQKILVWKGMTESEYKQLEKMDPEFDPSTKLFGVFKPNKDVYNQLIDLFHGSRFNQLHPKANPEIYLT